MRPLLITLACAGCTERPAPRNTVEDIGGSEAQLEFRLPSAKLYSFTL